MPNHIIKTLHKMDGAIDAFASLCDKFDRYRIPCEYVYCSIETTKFAAMVGHSLRWVLIGYRVNDFTDMHVLEVNQYHER